MHTLSTRTLSAIAYERGEEYDPSQPPVTPELMDELALFERARPIIGEDGPYEKARQRRRERRELSRIPEWFSAQDLIAAPWESVEQRFA
jgi:hypothetical protein